MTTRKRAVTDILHPPTVDEESAAPVRNPRHRLNLTQADLDLMLQPYLGLATVHARLERETAGGQPAGENGLKAFVEHHLHLTPDTPEFDQALWRIMHEEIGEKETTPEGGEVETAEVYQVNVIRKTEHGPYVLEHMIKALLKQAASRMGLFQAKGKVGSKGDMSELGIVRAVGESLRDPARPWEIYLRKNGGPVPTRYQTISGSVGTPKGKKSIQHETEVTEEKAELRFSFQWYDKRLTSEDIALIFAAASHIGLGSCLALGYGRLEILDLQIE